MSNNLWVGSALESIVGDSTGAVALENDEQVSDTNNKKKDPNNPFFIKGKGSICDLGPRSQEGIMSEIRVQVESGKLHKGHLKGKSFWNTKDRSLYQPEHFRMYAHFSRQSVLRTIPKCGTWSPTRTLFI